MQRSTILLSTSLVFCLTAAALLGLATQVRSPALAAPASEGGAVVHRFYDAVNDAIATGDATAFRAVVAPDLVEHDPIVGTGAGRDGLEAYLVSLHATAPDLRLAVEDVVAAGDRVVARVAAAGQQDRRFLGTVLAERPMSWGPVDLFRVEGDRIVERWGVTDGLVLIGDQVAAPLALAAPSRRIFALDRWAVAPGAGFPAVESPGPRLIWVEEGEATITPESAAVAAVVNGEGMHESSGAGQAVDPSSSVWLTAGQTLFLPEPTRYAVWNDGDETVRLLVATLEPLAPWAQVPPAAAGQPGVSVEPVTVSLATDLPAGAVSIQLGDATLAPGGHLSLPGFEGPLVVLARAGQLQLSSPDAAYVQRASDGRIGTETDASLGPGDSAYLKSDTAVDVWNAGGAPAEVVIVALRIMPSTEPVAASPAHSRLRVP